MAQVNTTAYYWGAPTASLDWCEPNYVKSVYIAEFWNTLSSLYLSLLAVFGLALSTYYRAETRVALAHVCLFVVGVGSAMFHATLLYWCQLLDELPMIYGSLVFVYCSLDTSQSKNLRKYIIPVLILYGLATTVIMLLNSNRPQLHQIAYAILVGAMVFRSLYIVYFLGPKTKKEQANFTYMFWVSVLVFLSGYAIWVTERKLCVNGSVIPGFQFHSLWHLLTGSGTFAWIQFIYYYRMFIQHKSHSLSVKTFLGLPVVVYSKTESKQLV